MKGLTTAKGFTTTTKTRGHHGDSQCDHQRTRDCQRDKHLNLDIGAHAEVLCNLHNLAKLRGHVS